MTKIKTLKIKEQTHRRLKEMGRKGESFDDILKRLLDFTESAKARSAERRLEKVEALGEFTRRRWERAVKSGRLKRTKTGWKVDPDVG